MKKIYLTIIAITAFIYACSNSKSVSDKTIHVYGNCEKCKARIEKAAKMKGVTDVNWNIDSKLLTYKIDTLVTGVNTVLQAIAAAGHDNDAFPGNDYTYGKLPQCCQYERKSE
jgi:mercuric ion binding protein